MKKGVVTIWGVCLLGLGALSASAAVTRQGTEQTSGDNKRVEIKADELPATVSQELAKSHPGTKISKAYKWEDEKGTLIGYEVVLKTDTGEQTVKFDADGMLRN